MSADEVRQIVREVTATPPVKIVYFDHGREIIKWSDGVERDESPHTPNK